MALRAQRIEHALVVEASAPIQLRKGRFQPQATASLECHVRGHSQFHDLECQFVEFWGGPAGRLFNLIMDCSNLQSSRTRQLLANRW